MSLLTDVQSLSHKVNKRDTETKIKDYVGRIQRAIMIRAAKGETHLDLSHFPRVRRGIGYDYGIFKGVVREFICLGFKVRYLQKDFTKFVSPTGRNIPVPSTYTNLTISWE
jgi:hypothetical protein